jgi:hypothetical protein
MALDRRICPCGCGKPLWNVMDGGIINPHMIAAAVRDMWALAQGKPAVHRW